MDPIRTFYRPTAWTIILLIVLLFVGVARMRWSASEGSEEFATSIHTLGDATLGTLWDWRTPT